VPLWTARGTTQTRSCALAWLVFLCLSWVLNAAGWLLLPVLGPQRTLGDHLVELS